MRLAYDIETTAIPSDGRLVHEVDKIHCISCIDIDTGDVYEFRPKELDAFISLASKSELMVAHNGIKFDLPVLKRFYPELDLSYPKHIDTVVLSRLVFPNRFDLDMAKSKKLRDKFLLPKKLYGLHSLESWGYRLGLHKGTYGKDNPDPWSTFSEEMLEYCTQDVRVTVELFKNFENLDYPESAIRLEHEVAELIAQQERNGFVFNQGKAEELYTELNIEKLEIADRLKEQFGTWYVDAGFTKPKRTVNYKDKLRASTVEGAEYHKVKLIEFNPSSRQHIAKVLQEMGWKPKEFTESGQPKIDESVLSEIEYSEAKDLKHYLIVSKLLGQLHDGDNGWLKMVKTDGRIHGSVNTNGAVTGRATHSRPNVAQVPSSSAFKGEDCRELFTVPTGWKLLGTDASGLELRCLAHYMARWDDGAYGNVILNGDIHTVNQQAAGLPTRNNAKTFIYGFLYGAGSQKLGEIVGKGAKEGNVLKRRFLSKIPALKRLQEAVQKQVEANSSLRGIDGRTLHVRSAHSALNTLLQSAGGLICKHWGVLIDKKLQELGYKHGWEGDYAFCAWVHDEYQIACRTEEIAETVGKVAKGAIRDVELHYDWRCPLDAEYAIGDSWKETH